eukprot:PhM_4_TR11328/c1_g1_i2/m.51738
MTYWKSFSVVVLIFIVLLCGTSSAALLVRMTTSVLHSQDTVRTAVQSALSLDRLDLVGAPDVRGYSKRDDKFVLELDELSARKLVEMVQVAAITPDSLTKVDVAWAEIGNNFNPKIDSGFPIWIVIVVGIGAILVSMLITCTMTRKRMMQKANVVTFAQMAKLEEDLYQFPYRRAGV